MSRRKYLSMTTVDITLGDADYILDVVILSIGNTGIGAYDCGVGTRYDKGQDYVEDWTIRTIRDAYGFPVSKDEADRIALEIGDDSPLVEYIQTNLDERLHDMMDYDMYEGRDE